MKRKRTLIILLGVLVLIFGGVVAVSAFEKHAESISTVDEVVFALDADALTEVKWTYDGTTLDFVKSEDIWGYSADVDFPVDQEGFAEFLDHFSEVHASFIIDEVTDYDQYGLKDPEATITFVTEDGETTISCGTYSTMDSKRYIMLEEGTVYLIDDDVEEYLTANKDDYLDNDEVPYYQTMEEVTVTGEQELSFIYEEDADYTYETSYNYYLLDQDNYKALSDSRVTEYLGYITHQTFTDYVTYKVTDDELIKWGFDTPDLTIYVKGIRYDTDFEDDEEGKEEEHTLYFSRIDDETVYLRVDDSKIIYNYPTEDYETLASTGYDGLRPTAVVDISEENVKSVTAKVDDESYEVLVEENGGETTYTVNGIETDASAVLTDLSALTITEFDKETTSDTEEFGATVILNDEAETTLNISILRVDGDQCLVKLNDETIGLMDRSLMTTLKEDFAETILNLGKEEETEE